MTRAREQIISLEATPYYHCISRCVRRAFLCGEDSLTGKNYEHRKAWVIERLRQLVEAFAIDVCAYAVMSNHYHLVLRVDRKLSASWTDAQVIERWAKLYNLPLLVARYTRGEPQSRAEVDEVHNIAERWRRRLTDISWFTGSGSGLAIQHRVARLEEWSGSCESSWSAGWLTRLVEGRGINPNLS